MVLNKSIQIPSTLEIIKTIGNKGEWKLKSPLQKWSFLYGIGRSCCKLFRVQVFEEDQTLHWFAYFPLVYAIVYLVLVVYTAVYYILHDELAKCLPCQGRRLQFSYSIAQNLRFLIFPVQHIYPHGEDDEDSEYYELCSKQIDASMRNFFFKMTIIFGSVIIGLFWPTYLFLSQGVKTTTTQVKFPLLDEDSNGEFIGNLLFQSVVVGHGFIGYIGLEVGMDILTDFISASQNLLEYRLRMLDRQRAKDPLADPQQLFRNVIQQIRTYDKFVICLRDLFYYRLLFTPTGFTYSIAVAIFCQFTMGYAAGYGLATLLWVQLYYLCELGEYTESNGLSRTLYNSNWYALPVKQQKDLMHMINGCQNGAKLDFGPFSVINRTFFKTITSNIYRYVMFLMNFES